MLLKYKFNIVGVSESWLSESTTDLYDIDYYKYYYNYKDEKTGGGVSLFVRNEITCIERKDLKIMNSIMEGCFMEIDKNRSGLDVIIGAIYKMGMLKNLVNQ